MHSFNKCDTKRCYPIESTGLLSQSRENSCRDSGKVEEFVIWDAVSGEQVFAGKSLYTAKSAWSDKTRTTLDFSAVTTPGNIC